MNKKILLFFAIFMGFSHIMQGFEPVERAATYYYKLNRSPYISFNQMIQGMLQELRTADTNHFFQSRFNFITQSYTSIIIFSFFLVKDLMDVIEIASKKNVEISHKVGLLLRKIALQYALPLFVVTHLYQAFQGIASESGIVGKLFSKRFLENIEYVDKVLLVAAMFLAFETGGTLATAWRTLRWTALTTFGGLRSMGKSILSTFGLSNERLRKRD